MPDTAKSDALASTLAALRSDYLNRWPEKLTRFAALIRELDNPQTAADVLANFRTEFHRLAGSGGSYGFPEVSVQGREAELFVVSIVEAGEPVSAESAQKIQEYIANLDSLFNAAFKDSGQKTPSEVPYPGAKPAGEGLRKIAVFDSDPAHIQALIEQGPGKGCEFAVWDQTEDPLVFLRRLRPHAVLTEFRVGGADGTDLCQKIKADPDLSETPVIFTSAQSDLDSRLKATRAGGISFFAKPILVDPLFEYLELVSGPPPDIPIRVLVVEDDPGYAILVQKVLKNDGYLTHICAKPVQILADLEEFNPDLLLLDVRLPGYNGFDLAQVVRQDRRYWMLPIIFMTAMKFDTGQLKALEAGGDDYLVKPIAPRLLLRSVRTRSERAFLLRSLSDQDGLTRILNRASMMRQFDGLLSRAKRYSEKMAVAMVDIDHFKSMNDTHGHQAGDAILRDLAQFLRKNIRQSDVVGRYGGEEFTLFFPQTDAQTAVATLDKLRVEFGKRNQSLPGGGFASVTFSGGVAEFPRSGEDRVSLIAAADSALYTSKEEGRNRISLAPS